MNNTIPSQILALSGIISPYISRNEDARIDKDPESTKTGL